MIVLLQACNYMEGMYAYAIVMSALLDRPGNSTSAGVFSSCFSFSPKSHPVSHCNPMENTSASSVDSSWDALADPAHRTGTSPLKIRLCLAGYSSLHDQSKESVLISGTTTDNIGIPGLYLATSFAVLPPRVRTRMREALAELAVRTAEDARLSSGLIGTGAFATILLNTSG
nr:hypothetical protein CTI12_AA520700 [Ipomoea batatas]GMD19410.1 hypothetical protein CTI12_AA520700 [Ipomoea batatas]